MVATVAVVYGQRASEVTWPSPEGAKSSGFGPRGFTAAGGRCLAVASVQQVGRRSPRGGRSVYNWLFGRADLGLSASPRFRRIAWVVWASPFTRSHHARYSSPGLAS